MQIYFLNHTRKEYVYVGEAENDDITFVFRKYNWKINERITMLRDIEDYEDIYELLEY